MKKPRNWLTITCVVLADMSLNILLFIVAFRYSNFESNFIQLLYKFLWMQKEISRKGAKAQRKCALQKRCDLAPLRALRETLLLPQSFFYF